MKLSFGKERQSVLIYFFISTTIFLMKKLLFVIVLISFNHSFASVFNVTITVGGSSKTLGYSAVEDVINAVKLEQIQSQFPAYTDSDAVSINVDFRGLPLALSAGAGSNDITLSIPDIGVNETFSGADRDASMDLLKDWLKKSGGDALNALMKKLAEVSPHDPIAGNPASLMSNMVGDDFRRGTSTRAIKKEDSQFNSNLVGVGLRIGQFDQAGLKGRVLTLPFSYTVRFDHDPRQQLIFEFPLTYYEVDKAKTYNARFAIAYRIPVTNNWYLTPNIGTGAVVSVDLGSGGMIVSGSLTSSYSRKFYFFRAGIGNMFGNYQTRKLAVSGYESDPDIKNQVLRNGLFFSIPHGLWGSKVESEIFFYDTRYFGDKLYMDQYNEVGISLGTDKDRKDAKRLIRIGLSHLFSPKTKGYTFNFGYKF